MGGLLVEIHDGKERRSSLAVLDAGRITEGPVARVLFDHHVPISFHGYWKPRAWPGFSHPTGRGLSEDLGPGFPHNEICRPDGCNKEGICVHLPRDAGAHRGRRELL